MEFCDECGGIMTPSRRGQRKVLLCKCGETKPLDEDLIEGYVFTTKIDHPMGE